MTTLFMEEHEEEPGEEGPWFIGLEHQGRPAHAAGFVADKKRDWNIFWSDAEAAVPPTIFSSLDEALVAKTEVEAKDFVRRMGLKPEVKRYKPR